MTAPPREPEEPAAIADYFRSIDSAPAGYAVDRPASASNGFLITFVGLCILALCIRMLTVHGIGPFHNGDLVILVKGRGDVAVPTRVFIIIFFITYAAYAYTNIWRRVFLGLSLLGKFVLFCLAVDVVGWLLAHFQVLETSAFGQQMISGLVALAIFPHTVMRQAQLPPKGDPPTNSRTSLASYLKLFLCLVVSIIGASIVLHLFTSQIDVMRKWALLGGIGPGVFLVQQLFAASTAVFGWWELRRTRGLVFDPPVAVVVPAHNEAHDIGDTIASIDRAAESYTGRIHLYVIDNASSDATTAVAEQALAACTVITGEVLQCPQPGKAIALNLGISRVTEDFVVRIDADSVIAPGCLQTAMRHFLNPRVGAVGGMPMPAEEKTWIDKVRLVEVYLRHGFFQVSLVGYHGVLGVPGMFAIYRRSALEEVGPMVQGMNGEDTDICMRLSGAGYRTVADPQATYYSETPLSYAHLREQRVRWFRSIYHLTAHNRDLLFDRRSMTGTFVLPFQLVNAARRAMLGPILIFALIVQLGFRATFPSMQWQAAVATVLGMPMIVTVLVCLLWRPSAVKYVPAYLCFRLLRSYFTLGSALSLIYPPMPAPTPPVLRAWAGAQWERRPRLTMLRRSVSRSGSSASRR